VQLQRLKVNFKTDVNVFGCDPKGQEKNQRLTADRGPEIRPSGTGTIFQFFKGNLTREQLERAGYAYSALEMLMQFTKEKEP